jgi:hypothetical protein
MTNSEKEPQLLSDSLTSMYQRIFKEDPDKTDVGTGYQKVIQLLLQDASQTQKLLEICMFNVPVDVMSTFNTDPEKAKMMLALAIGGSLAAQDVIDIESGGPTKAEFEFYLTSIGFYEQFHPDQL